mmetsp:Transcript_37757/g.91001  ORF Transcript_37757/g.91001 Transcript_37757/m.91001 type:complete len:143 (-) Transcript_37757:504-932(-)
MISFLPHLRQRQTCGYVTFLLSNSLFFVYFLWALLPDHIMKHIDDNYTTYYYYPPRELAGYIPAYISLLFVFVPILYMGLNMLTCPKVDSIDGIWDTRSNACAENENERGNANNSNQIDPLPTICDEDVRSVNLRIRQQLSK